MDQLWPGIATAVMQPVFGSLLGDLNAIRGLNSDAGQSYVDKDLRRLLGEPELGPFHLRYCGNGSLTACRASLWSAFDQAVTALAGTYGPESEHVAEAASRTGFTPGLIPDTMRSTNRPTFQQVLELQRR